VLKSTTAHSNEVLLSTSVSNSTYDRKGQTGRHQESNLVHLALNMKSHGNNFNDFPDK